MKIKANKLWRNVIKKYSARPPKTFWVENLEDIATAIKTAEAAGQRIRAVGSGHSYSDVALPDGFMVRMDKLNKVQRPDYGTFRQAFQNTHLVTVQGGVTIQRLNKQLEKMDLALINMGAIDEQTISGACATNTHGTGHKLPAIPGMVRSILMVAAQGKAYRIEPENGVTDPAQHQESGVTLIQNNDTFNAVVVHLGNAGIVHSYVLEVRPMYWLQENRVLSTWQQVKQQLQDGSLFNNVTIEHNGAQVTRPLRSLFVVVNPYLVKNNTDRTCMVSRVVEVNKPRKRSLADRTRNIVAALIGNLPPAYWFTIIRVNYFPKGIPNTLESSLKYLQDPKYVNKSYKVLYQGFEYVAKRGHGAEFAYNSQALDYLPAIDKVFDEIAQMSASQNVFPSSAMTLRWVQKSQVMLAPEYEQDVCYVGNAVLVKQREAEQILDVYQNIHIAAGGKAHWGKITNKLNEQPQIIAQWYPRLANWRTEIKRFNPNGTFNNGFTDRLGLLD